MNMPNKQAKHHGNQQRWKHCVFLYVLVTHCPFCLFFSSLISLHDTNHNPLDTVTLKSPLSLSLALSLFFSPIPLSLLSSHYLLVRNNFPSALINLTPLISFITLSSFIYHLSIWPLIHLSPGVSSLLFIQSVAVCLFCICAFIFPSFVFLIFFFSFYIVFLSSRVPAVHWTEGESLDKSLSLCPSPLLILTSPTLLSSLLLPPSICLSQCIPPFVYLLTSIHLFYLCHFPHAAPSLSVHRFYCSLQLIKHKGRKGKLNKATEMYLEGDNLINEGCLVTVNNVALLVSQCPRCD